MFLSFCKLDVSMICPMNYPDGSFWVNCTTNGVTIRTSLGNVLVCIFIFLLFIYSFVYLFIHLFIFIYLFIHLFIFILFLHLFIFIYLFIFIHLFIYIFIYLFIHSFIYLFICWKGLCWCTSSHREKNVFICYVWSKEETA